MTRCDVAESEKWTVKENKNTFKIHKKTETDLQFMKNKKKLSSIYQTKQ